MVDDPPRRRGRGNAHGSDRYAAAHRYPDPAWRTEYRRDRSVAARRRAYASQQPRRRQHRRRARQASRASGFRRTECRRAHMAQSAQVGCLGRSCALHHSTPAGKAGRHADQRIVADCVSDARIVPAEDRRVSAHHLRPLRPPGRAADDLFRQHYPLCPRRRRGPGGGRSRLCEPDQHLAHAARRHPPGRAERQRHRARLPRPPHRTWQAPSGDPRSRRLRRRSAALERVVPADRYRGSAAARL